MNRTYKPAVRPHLEWIGAPWKTEWGADMMEALIELSKDETARLYVSKSAIPLVEGALRALLGNQSTALVCAPGGPDTA